MVTIRLARFGSKKRPYYHIVVTDSESPRDGKFLEQIGTYDPTRPVADARIDLTRVDHWVGVGAQPSTRVRHVLNDYRRLQASA
jgi:small subunit ribosomal protein S16